MIKYLRYAFCGFIFFLGSFYNKNLTHLCAQVLLDAHCAAGGATSWNITTTHPNELIIISAGGYGTGGNALSTAAGTIKVNGSNATYENRGLWLSGSFSWTASIWACNAPTAGTYTCTCTETGLNSPFYFNFASAVYDPGCTLGLSDIVVGGNNNNQSATTISATITTPINGCWVYGTVDNNDNGNTGVVAWNSQLTQLNFTYINDGVDGAQADSVYATAGTYTITSTDIGASNVWMTIALIAVKPVCVLPVQLLNFSCTDDGNSIRLNWSTATEQNSSKFTIERSADGTGFASIANLPAAGNSTTRRNYSFLDESPLPGENYYRLTETDLDGNSQTFNITSCSVTTPVNIIYPNPNHGTFTLTLGAATSYQSLIITDMTGRQVFEQQFAPGPDIGSYTIHLPAGMSGVYIAKIIDNGQVVRIKKIMVF